MIQDKFKDCNLFLFKINFNFIIFAYFDKKVHTFYYILS